MSNCNDRDYHWPENFVRLWHRLNNIDKIFNECHFVLKLSLLHFTVTREFSRRLFGCTVDNYRNMHTINNDSWIILTDLSLCTFTNFVWYRSFYFVAGRPTLNQTWFTGQSISLSNLPQRYVGYWYRLRLYASYEDGITGSYYFVAMHHTRRLRCTDVSRFYVNVEIRVSIEFSERETEIVASILSPWPPHYTVCGTRSICQCKRKNNI